MHKECVYRSAALAVLTAAALSFSTVQANDAWYLHTATSFDVPAEEALAEAALTHQGSSDTAEAEPLPHTLITLIVIHYRSADDNAFTAFGIPATLPGNAIPAWPSEEAHGRAPVTTTAED